MESESSSSSSLYGSMRRVPLDGRQRMWTHLRAPKQAGASNQRGQAPVSKTGVAHKAKGSTPSPSSKWSVAAAETVNRAGP